MSFLCCSAEFRVFVIVMASVSILNGAILSVIMLCVVMLDIAVPLDLPNSIFILDVLLLVIFKLMFHAQCLYTSYFYTECGYVAVP